jgi:hypothetical protein
MSAKAIVDLVRAQETYRLPNAQLVAVTNAEQFSAAAKAQARQQGVILVTGADLVKPTFFAEISVLSV